MANKTGKGGFAAHPENINRSGRPKKGSSFAEVLRSIGTEMHGDVSRLEIACRQMYELAESGDYQAIKWIADRVDGRSKQTTEFLTPIELPTVTLLEIGEVPEAGDVVIQ